MPHPLLKGAFLTTAEAAAVLRISPATLKRWAQSGLIPSERTEGGHRRFAAEDLRALSAPSAGPDDPVHRGAALVVEAADALTLQGWLLQARRELGSWWSVAEALRGVVAEVYRRRSAGQLNAVQVEVGLDRLRGALLRFLDTLTGPPGAPTLLVAALPGDPYLVAPAFLQVAAPESGWRAEWVGHPEAADLAEELRRRAVGAVVVCASLGSSAEAMKRHSPRLDALAAELGVPMATLGMGTWPETRGPVARFTAVSELRAWLEAGAAAPARAPAPPAAWPPPASAPPPELRWDPALSIGDEVVDAQHQTLFSQGARFIAAVRAGEEGVEVAELLRFIADYAQVHFRFEEHLMRTTGYPGLSDHLFEHEALTRRLAGMVDGLAAAPGREGLEDLAAFLASWLQGHVGGSDQRIKVHLRARGLVPPPSPSV